jgi:hypothetical protein
LHPFWSPYTCLWSLYDRYSISFDWFLITIPFRGSLIIIQLPLFAFWLINHSVTFCLWYHSLWSLLITISFLLWLSGQHSIVFCRFLITISFHHFLMIILFCRFLFILPFHRFLINMQLHLIALWSSNICFYLLSDHHFIAFDLFPIAIIFSFVSFPFP